MSINDTKTQNFHNSGNFIGILLNPDYGIIVSNDIIIGQYKNYFLYISIRLVEAGKPNILLSQMFVRRHKSTAVSIRLFNKLKKPTTLK